MAVLPVIAALIGAGFAAAVLVQWSSRRRPYQLAWGAALAMFALAAAFEAAGEASGWGDATYRGYYLFGAILNVGWLAVGTLYIATPGSVARWGAIAMGVLTLLAVVLVLASHTNPVLLRAQVPGRGAISAPASIMPPITNILGSVILIGGAAWSAWKAYSRQLPAGRVLGTALIAAGAFVVAGGHSYAQTHAAYALQPVSEAVGIAIMFAGYLAVESARAPQRQPSPV